VSRSTHGRKCKKGEKGVSTLLGGKHWKQEHHGGVIQHTGGMEQVGALRKEDVTNVFLVERV